MPLNIPRQNSYSASLTQKLDADAAALLIYADSVPICTIPANTYLEMTINPKRDFTLQEVVLVESINTANSTMTIASGGRAQDRYNGDTPTPLEHSVGATITLSNPYSLWVDVETAIDNKFGAGGTLTGDFDFNNNDSNTTFRLPNMTTTERDAIGTPANGMLIYNTTTGEFQYYDGGAWQTVGTASVPNASETVAGIIELATNAEMGAGTSVGGTGARLVPPNDQLVKTSSGSADENKIAVLDASGKFATGMIPSVSTDIMEHTLDAGEAINGTTTPQAVYISDGTNSRTVGRFYLADADDTTNMAVKVFGFVKVNASTIGDPYAVQYGGIVPGFTGLDEGEQYYLSTTAGAITKTPTNTTVPIGIAVSATELLVLPQSKSIYATYTFNTASGTIDTQLLTGFRVSEAHAISDSTYGSIGFWQTGMGTSANAGFCRANRNIAPYVNTTTFLAHANWTITGSTTFGVFAIDDQSITIRRTESNSGTSITMYLILRS